MVLGREAGTGSVSILQEARRKKEKKSTIKRIGQFPDLNRWPAYRPVMSQVLTLV